MKRSGASLAGVLAVVGLVAACAPVADQGQAPTPVQSSSTPAPPSPPSTPVMPTPTEGPENPPPAQPTDPWALADLVSTCKVAWNESGAATDWSAYSPDAVTAIESGSYYVDIPARADAERRDCTITGTPEAPLVELGRT
jgi:hypothetical protein